MDKRRPLATLARHAMQRGDEAEAITLLSELIGAVLDAQVSSLSINHDVYSLNSLNGRVVLTDGRQLFYKYHQEDGEDNTVAEYYNAAMLEQAGYWVDVPIAASGEPGRQILLYRLHNEPRMSDVCLSLDDAEYDARSGPVPDADIDTVMASQHAADTHNLECGLHTLHHADDAEIAAEPIHQLFGHRLHGGGTSHGIGGRAAAFYGQEPLALGSTEHGIVTLSPEEFWDAKWVINGQEYADSVGDLFKRAADVLAPQHMGGAAIVAHGDAHNANVWFTPSPDGHRQVMFDPAFAGAHVPALLGEVKPTFHNIFAHPYWLYQPERVRNRFTVSVTYDNGVLNVEHDWHLNAIRSACWESKRDRYWVPFLTALREQSMLQHGWQDVIRSALFCCPTLVLNLTAGSGSGHTPESSALGFALAVGLGSPAAGSTLDVVDALDRAIQSVK